MNRVARQHTKLGLARIMLAVMALAVGGGAFQAPPGDPAAGVEGVNVDNAIPAHGFVWETVVNNNDSMPLQVPGEPKNFNSYNQPSVNMNGLVVIRARSRGGEGGGGEGGEGGGGHRPTHGIYTRNMAVDNSPIISILDRTSLVPQPNNLPLATFVETPSSACSTFGCV